jgi:Undecaprenyl-phosphate glucose phosphotransferase
VFHSSLLSQREAELNLQLSSTAIRSSSLTTITAKLLILSINLLLIFALAILSDRYISGYGQWFHRLSTDAIFISILFFIAMFMAGALRNDAIISRRMQGSYSILSWIGVFCLGAWLLFVFKAGTQFSRIGVIGFFLIGIVVLPLANIMIATYFRKRVRDGSLILEKVAIVLKGRLEDLSIQNIALRKQGIFVGGAHFIDSHVTIDEVEAEKAATFLKEVVITEKCERILVFAPWAEFMVLQEALSRVPTRITIIADRAVTRVLHHGLVNFDSLSGFDVQRPPLSRSEMISKRIMDILVASLGLIVLSPLIAMTALAILYESGRPVFFRQSRKGFGGKSFDIFKFRSMTVAENGANVIQAVANDPRVTRLGAMLRKSSLDEVPQLLNVLRGDMSIVGPRPHALAHDNKYDAEISSYSYRQHVKPGITGWAQVNGFRGETRESGLMEARVDHDLWYISNWSFLLDLKIVALTVPRLLKDRNAY